LFSVISLYTAVGAGIPSSLLVRRLHGVMTQKNPVSIVTTMPTSNHILQGVWGQYWGKKLTVSLDGAWKLFLYL